MSLLDAGADGSAGIAGGGGKSGCSSGVFDLGSRLPLYPCAPLDMRRWAFGGLVAPGMGVGVARPGIIWAPPLIVVSLSSSVEVSFYPGEKRDERDEMGITFLLLLLFMD